MKVCSACLLGIKCRYNGTDALNKKVLELGKNEILIPICPEILGGMKTPRESAELVNGSGYDVLDGKAKIIEKNGRDVTRIYLKGASEGLKIAKGLKIKEAIVFTERGSPSCGCGKIYVSGKEIEDDGVFTALLKKNGIKVIREKDF